MKSPNIPSAVGISTIFSFGRGTRWNQWRVWLQWLTLTGLHGNVVQGLVCPQIWNYKGSYIHHDYMKNLNPCKAEYFRYFDIRVQEQVVQLCADWTCKTYFVFFVCFFLAFKKCNCTSSSKYIFVDSWQKSPFIYFYTSTFLCSSSLNNSNSEVP